MKKILTSVVTALMGLGLLVSVSACSNGGSGSSVPSVPKVESVAAASLEASGAETYISSEAELLSVLEALEDDPFFESVGVKKNIAILADIYDDDWDLGDDDGNWNWDLDDEKPSLLPGLEMFDELIEDFGEFMMATMEYDNDGKASASLKKDYTYSIEDVIPEINGEVEAGELKVAANLSGSGKVSVNSTGTKVTQTQSFSGSVSEAFAATVKPTEKSALKKIEAASAGAVTLSGVKVSNTMDMSNMEEMGDLGEISGSGKVSIAVAGTAGTSVCTEDGLGGKIIVSANGLASVNVADIVALFNEIDMDAMESEDLPFDPEEVLGMLTASFEITIKVYDDDGAETFSKTYKDIEELAKAFGGN